MITMAAPREKVVSRSTKKVARRRKERVAVPSGDNASPAPKQESAAPKQKAAAGRTKRGAVKPPPPDAKTLLSEIRKIYSKYAEDELTKKYQIGERLETGDGNPRRYGEEFVARVATELGLSESTLHRWKDVVVRFPVDTFERARSHAAKQRVSLRWTHFEHLATVRDPSERQRILRKVVKDGLNTSQTAELVYEVLNPNSVRGGVSGLRKPRSATAGLKTMENLGMKFLDLCSCYDECVITEIGAKDKHDAKEIERLKANQKLLDEMVEAATGAREAVGQLLSNIEELNAEAEAQEREAKLPTRARRTRQIDEEDRELFAS